MAAPVQHITKEELIIWEILEKVNDPEIPVLSIVDLGIVRQVKIIHPEKHIEVSITPTYSGCPAMDVIRINVCSALKSHGYVTVDLKEVLSPAWTTAWMSENGKKKLQQYGIAPPASRHRTHALFETPEDVACPLCGAAYTRMLSEFGSTSCKALYQCDSCKEPFDVFKCH